MDLFDSVILGDARVTRDGYLVADARIARTGIQVYAGYEVGKPDLAKVRVYRPEAEVFAKDAMASFAHRPVTIEHPSEAVTAGNWKKYAVGDTGGEVARDGDFVRVPLTLMDQAAIEALRAGKRELSAGYSCDLEWTAGTTPQGEAYDAVQKNIRANHLAIVDAARAGPECRIGDDGGKASDHKGGRRMSDKTLRTIVVDGLSIEVTDQGAQAIEKLNKQLADAKAEAERKEGEAKAKLAEKDEELKKKDGEIAALKAQIPDAAKLDAMASARAELVADARSVLGDTFDAKGKSEAEIRRAVVTHRLGDAAKDMSDAHVEGAFKVVMAKKDGADPLRDALRHGGGPGDPRVQAYGAMHDHLVNAWKGDSKEAR